MRGTSRLVIVLLALGALVQGSACVRMRVARHDPGFDASSPVGMLRSDPALLYYITERVLEAPGLLPDDLRADPRVEHPEGADLLAEFSVGQELLVAWTYPWLASGAPLHVHAQRVMALCASLALIGVFLCARAATGSARLGLWAAALSALLPASYRTIGFILVREDLSLPLFALHAGLCAAAAASAGRRSALCALAAGGALAAALATWHAMTFVATLEALAVLATAVLTGARPLAGGRGALVLVPLVFAGVLAPPLRASGFLFSPPMVVAATLLLLPALAGARAGRARRALVAALLALGLGLAALLAARLGWTGAAELGHVYEVMLAKVRFLGVPPADPNRISFDARLLWQGPFATLALGEGVAQLGLSLALGALGAWVLWRAGPPAPLPCALLAFAALALPAAWLVSRLIVLAALVLPVLAALAVGRLPRRGATWLAAGALLFQGALFLSFAARYEISWYRPVGLAPEQRALVAALPELVPPEEAVCADFVTSTAVLAHTRRPIVLQPKYETERSRRKSEAFLTTFFHGTPADLAALIKGRFRCRYLLVDRYTLGFLSPWTAGLKKGEEPAPGTAAAVFLSQDPAVLASVPGYELLYRSPPSILQRNGEPYDLYRLYRLSD